MSEKSIEPLPPRLPMNDTEEQSLHDAKEEEDVAEFPEGGFMAWCAVAGSWFTMFCTFGLAVAFGVFQSYYKYHLFPEQSSSTISWIGSIQLFFQFSMGAISGPLYDKGYFRALTLGGSTVFIVSFFMVSLCKEFWQVMLAQAVGTGIGIGFLFLPAVSVLSHYFLRRRSLAIGIAVTGSSVGGIVLPIMLNRLIQSHGFERAVQYTGYLLLGCLILANALIHPRITPGSGSGPKPSLKVIFSDKGYCMLVTGLFFVAWGLFFPIFYLQIFAQQYQLGQVLVTYTLAILNAASVIGRITPNFLADKFGPLNLLIIMCFGSGVLCFAVFGATTQAGLICVAILFGFFQGAYVSLSGPALIATAKSFNEIGARMGMGFLIMSFAALTGTPITGALLDRYGQAAPITWSGVTILTGAAFVFGSRMFQAEHRGTWKV